MVFQPNQGEFQRASDSVYDGNHGGAVINLVCSQVWLEVHVIGIPEKSDLVQCLLDPLRPACAASPRAHLTGWAERG